MFTVIYLLVMRILKLIIPYKCKFFNSAAWQPKSLEKSVCGLMNNQVDSSIRPICFAIDTILSYILYD